MTRDLDELERKAKAASEPHGWTLEADEAGPRYVMAGTFPVVNAYSSERADAEFIAAANPSIVLALIERVRTAEAQCAGNAAFAQKALEREVLAKARIAKLERDIVEMRAVCQRGDCSERVRALEAAVKSAREQAAGVVAALCIDEDD